MNLPKIQSEATFPIEEIAVSIDFEFSRLPLPGESLLKWSQQVCILSLGLCAEDTRLTQGHYYTCMRITDAVERQCSAFVRRHILDLMQPHRSALVASSESELAAGVQSFLRRLERETGKKVSAMSDWVGDLVLFWRLMGDDTPTLVDAESAIKRGLDLEGEACRAGLVEHHALDDAIRNARALAVYRRSVLACAS